VLIAYGHALFRRVEVAHTRTHSNAYAVDAALVGRKVELLFDPLSRARDKGSYADLGVIPIVC
jgi:hypothetical protein